MSTTTITTGFIDFQTPLTPGFRQIGGRPPEAEGSMFDGRSNDGTFDDGLKFSHVPRPIVLLELLYC